jgi:CzcA family heavy metal efflux pump
MLRFIVATSLKFRFLVLAIAAGMIYFGIGQIRSMPVDVFPEFAPPMVEIQTVSIGLNPAEVENLVTIPLEEVLAGVPGLDVMRSKSVPDLSSIKMIFETGTDLMDARQLVQERVSLVTPTLPTWAAPPVILPPLSATSRMLKIGMSSETLSPIDLSMIAYWTVRQRLLQVPGVANVAIWGERLEMLTVQADPERMQKHRVSLDEIMEATADALDVGILQYSDGHIIGSGGWVETPNQRLPIHHVQPLIFDRENVTPDELAHVVVRRQGENGSARALFLSDVADVVIGHQPMIGDGIINDKIGLLLIVEKFPWGNTLQVTRDVEKALDALRPGLPEVEIDHEIFRPATFIEMSIENLGTALVIASILVVMVLFVFLYEWRVALISCTAIPLSLMAGALVLAVRDTTINTMVLAGFVIALGAVVDDAIVDAENIFRRLREHRKAGGKLRHLGRIVVEASFEVRRAIIFSTLIEIMALVPVFFMEGLSGAFFKPLALSYALAIAASTTVALTVTPAMSFILLRNVPLEKRESPIIRVLHGAYENVLTRIVRTPRPAFMTVSVIAVAGVAVVPQLGQELLPSFKERDFLMHWLTKPGTSWPEMNRITIQGSKELREIPGVRNFGAHIGQALIMDEVVGMYFGENWISVDPSVDYDETLDTIQTTVDGYPGLFRDVLTYLKERIREVLTGSSDAIVVRIYGRELNELHRLSHEVKESLEGVEGLVELHAELHEEIPQIEIKVDLEMATAYGLKPGDIRRAVARMIAHEEVGDIHRNNRTYDVVIWSTPETRHSLTALRELPIDFPGGGSVPLSEVADVRVGPTPNVIEREHLKRRIDVSANVRGRDLGSAYADVKAVLDSTDFPEEYHPELLGEYTERLAAQEKIFTFSIVAVIAIFLLLHTAFGSARLATLSFLLLPSALVGGALAAYATGGVISLGSLVGFLTVLGISARNGILMINHFQHLEREEGMSFGVELVLRGARERLAPILMTAMTTGLALVPLAVAGQIPGNEIEHPMALVILGGLVTSTALNLFVIPSLYLRFGSSNGRGATEPGHA